MVQNVLVIDETSMTLLTDYKGQFVGGWWFTEKLNGVRAYWDGRQFWTRGGNIIDAPKWFTKDLPSFPLDGEIHAGRGRGFLNDNSAYKVAMTAVRQGGEWFSEMDDGEPIRFTAFDAPAALGNWRERMAIVPRGTAIAYTEIKTGPGRNLSLLMEEIHRCGGEGGVLRHPEAPYEKGRSKHLLRWKFTKG